MLESLGTKEYAHQRITWTPKMKEDLKQCKKYAEKEFVRLQSAPEPHDDSSVEEGEAKKKREIKKSVICLIKEKWEEMGYGSLGRTENHLRDQLRSLNLAVMKRQDLLGMFFVYPYFLYFY
jgi:hypothetical protein